MLLLSKMAQLAVRSGRGGFDLGVLDRGNRGMSGFGVFPAASPQCSEVILFVCRLQETSVCIREGDGVGTDGLSPMSGLSGRSR